MKQGKIQQSILERAVLQKIGHRRPQILTKPAAGTDFAAVLAPDVNAFGKAASPEAGRPDAKLLYVSHVNTMCGSAKECGQLAVLKAAAGLWAGGAAVYGVQISVLMPDRTDEQDLRAFMSAAEASCEQTGIEIMGGHTQVTGAVNEFVVTVCAHGFLEKGRLADKGRVCEGDDLVMTGYAGLSGTAVIAKRAGGQLNGKYNPDFIESAAELIKLCSPKEAAEIACGFGVSAVHDISSTGIFGALWEFASWSGRGFKIDLKKILLKQETVEICNYFDLNPYRLESLGALLIAVSHGEQLVHLLKKAGIAAAVIGEITGDNDKLIINDDERGCMEPPRCCEMSKIEWRKV